MNWELWHLPQDPATQVCNLSCFRSSVVGRESAFQFRSFVSAADRLGWRSSKNPAGLPTGTQELTHWHLRRNLFPWRDQAHANKDTHWQATALLTRPPAPAWASPPIPHPVLFASCIEDFPFAPWSFYPPKVGFPSAKSHLSWGFRRALWRGVKFPAGWRLRNPSDCCVSPESLNLPLACSMAASLRPSRGSALHAALWLVPLRSPIPLPKSVPERSKNSSASSSTASIRECGCR
jgi:hypothetical protein